eukprot:m.17796 g.17796  ORF g.17796 m.17796 type:complete len:74 (-) comp8366_c0_seq1:292-513(-)
MDNNRKPTSLFQLLLGSEVAGVTALLLTAVLGTGVEASVALAANHLVAVVLLSEELQVRLNDTTTQTEDKVEG